VSERAGRSALLFPEAVAREFAFLESLGYKLAHRETTLVRFESSRMDVIVYHGRRSHEIHVELAPKGIGRASYDLTNVMDLIGNTEEQPFYATHTASGVKKGVKQVATAFRACIDAGVLADPKIFSRLKKQAKEAGKEYAAEVALYQARRIAESAWSEKKYRDYVRALKPFRSQLTDVERKKLSYATKEADSKR
jgi:hypothetical protein